MSGYEPSTLYVRQSAVWDRDLCIMLGVNFAFWVFSEVELPLYGVLRSSLQK
jgi:hypothetical protein